VKWNNSLLAKLEGLLSGSNRGHKLLDDLTEDLTSSGVLGDAGYEQVGKEVSQYM
jgi:hypothetical protein